MTQPRKRTVHVALTAREQQDPGALLDKVREACRARRVQLQVVKEKSPALPRPGQQLETAVNELASAVLKSKAKEVRQQTRPADKKRSVAKWLSDVAKAGWEVTVWAVLGRAKRWLFPTAPG